MFTSKYGVARHIFINVPKAGSANHAVGADWTPSAGDVKISKDGGAAANVTNLPTAIAMGNSAIWDFSLTATEMQAAQVNITVADSATKAVDDTGFVIETYGNASAQHAFDLGTASTAQTGDSFARIGAPAGASTAADIAAVKAQTAAIETDTAEIGAAGAGLTAVASAANLATVAGYLDTEIAAIQAKTNNLPASPASTSDVLTQVNAAIDTAISELGVAAPTATPTLRTGLMLLYMALRNKLVVQTSGTDALEIYNDAGTKITSKLLTDTGGDYTEAKAT